MNELLRSQRGVWTLFLSRPVPATILGNEIGTLLHVDRDKVYVHDHEATVFLPGADAEALVSLFHVPGGEFPVRADVFVRHAPLQLNDIGQLAQQLDLEIVTFVGHEDAPVLVCPNDRRPVPVNLESEEFWNDRVVLTPESRAKVDALVHAA